MINVNLNKNRIFMFKMFCLKKPNYFKYNLLLKTYFPLIAAHRKFTYWDF